MLCLSASLPLCLSWLINACIWLLFLVLSNTSIQTFTDRKRRSHEENTDIRLRETKRHKQRNHELELECYVNMWFPWLLSLDLYFGKMRSHRESLWYMRDWEFFRLSITFCFLASGYRIAYSFVFLNIFLKFFQVLKFFLGIFIKGCEFKRIYKTNHFFIYLFQELC